MGGGVLRHKQDTPRRLSAQAAGMQMGLCPSPSSRAAEQVRVYQGSRSGAGPGMGHMGPHPESQGGPASAPCPTWLSPLPRLVSFAPDPSRGNPSLAPRSRHSSPDLLSPPHPKAPAGCSAHHQSAGLSAPGAHLQLWLCRVRNVLSRSTAARGYLTRRFRFLPVTPNPEPRCHRPLGDLGLLGTTLTHARASQVSLGEVGALGSVTRPPRGGTGHPAQSGTRP